MLLAAGMVLAHCSPKLNPTSSAASLSEKIKATASNWDEMAAATKYNDRDTYIPERGIRGRYQIASQRLGKEVLEGIVGEKAFVSGPHTAGVNYFSNSTFGHYNPEFLQSLQKMLASTFASSTFVKSLQPLYDRELKQYLQTYYLTYAVGTNRKDIASDYQALLKRLSQQAGTESEASYFLQEAFRHDADQISGGDRDSYVEGGSNYDWYESVVCAGFWLRRDIDGTADAFLSLLTLTLKTFDPGFMAGR